ncbi:CorA family divalent cation transporter [Pedobacter mucosus]|uniref:CorA family divalent cation transporter n=1 Tax=Pedobacter mucosus TaxID=2895286 RepID=UPI001EE42EF9|nr:CorA family divalent cation transporter [Pedobacter mucosus]UKT64266.1 hypothetical protein LOK61_00475 [Pedobacter mucosus]
MIEVLGTDKQITNYKSVNDIDPENLEFYVMQFVDYTDVEISWAEKTYELNTSILTRFEDIEISSHFLADEKQVSLHISIPYYNTEKELSESPVFFLITQQGLFLFSNHEVDDYLNKSFDHKFAILDQLSNLESYIKFQIEFISDYYADIIELETKKVKLLASKILLEKEFSKDVMDLITRYKFNNLLLKESLIETTRVFNLYKKSPWHHKYNIKATIEAELSDLSVVSDYIQFNFDRLNDLKENVSNKIDLEQNHIFKMLTVVTVCISLPTLIAGIYGMNFENMPELKSFHGYFIALIAMLFAAILPYFYFKRKKWF